MENVRLLLTGMSNGKTGTFLQQTSFPLREEAMIFCRLWPRGEWVVDGADSHQREQKELRDEVVDLGTRYGIVTPYTSYLASSPAPSSVMLRVYPLTVAGDWRRTSGTKCPGNVTKADATRSRNAGVRQSKRTRALQESERLEKDELSSA